MRSSRRACRPGTGLPAWSRALEASGCRGAVVLVTACQSRCTRFSSELSVTVQRPNPQRSFSGLKVKGSGPSLLPLWSF